MKLFTSGSILCACMVVMFVLPLFQGCGPRTVTYDEVMATASITSHAPIYIDDDADFSSQAIAESWPGNGSASAPYRIENYEIEIISGQGIRINENVTAHYVIDNCIIYGNSLTTGVLVLGGNAFVTNCEIHDVKSGVAVENTNGTVKSNMIYDFDREGIRLRNTTDARTGDNILIGYTRSWTGSYPTGIHMTHAPIISALVENNVIINCSAGIFSEAVSSTFINNSISLCRFAYVEHGDNNYFINNTVTFCTEIGIQMVVTMSENNHIYYNYILNNTVNAEDNGMSNQWDDGQVLGNYWNEGFGPVYEIAGDANAVDRYPFYIENIPPIIEEITVKTLTIGASSTITWNVHDLTPNLFWVYVNSSLFQSGAWNSDTITVDFSSLETGLYNVTIVVQDRNGYSGTDQMILYIITGEKGGYDIVLIAGSVIALLIVGSVIVFLKKR